jgi:hypothetical protein
MAHERRGHFRRYRQQLQHCLGQND